MATNYCVGTFVRVELQEDIDNMLKMGFPEKDAKAMLGNHWRMRIELNDGRWTWLMTCAEMPCLNMLESGTIPGDINVDSPLFGGKAKLSSKVVGDNTIKGCIRSETLGDIEFVDKYCADGLCTTYTSKGNTFTQKWCREVEEQGWFTLVKQENSAAFWKELDMPYDPTDDCDMLTGLAKCGDGYKLTEIFGGTKLVTCYKLDEEIDYNWPGMDAKYSRKMITTKTGVGKFSILCKGPAGELEEWRMSICEKGMMYEGINKKTGTKAKMYFDRMPKFYGKWRMVSNYGYDEMGRAMGMSSEFTSQLKNDYTSCVTMCPKKGMNHLKVDSKVMPWDCLFKWDEEFETKCPPLPDTFKVVYSRCGNTTLGVSKFGKHTVCTTFTATANFAVLKGELKGTGICDKTIYERIC